MRGNVKHLALSILTATGGVGLILLAACQQRPSSLLMTVGGDSITCPDHNIGIPGGDTILPIAGSITTIAEFHDCQRLVIRPNANAYTILAGIWVSEALDTLVNELNNLNPWVDSAHKADSLQGSKTVAQAYGTGLTFALVYAWDGDYPALGITRGWNCLRLFPSSHPSLHLYAARMEPTSDPESCVSARSAEETRGMDLVVHDHAIPGFSSGDYPPVGRWEWDIERQQQYISLKCADAWCDVTGGEQYVASQDYKLPPGATKNRRRVFEVKGWYDEQRLAIGTPGALHPAPIQGTVFPDPDIDAIDDTSAFASTWIPAAQIGLKGPLPVYEKKYRMAQGHYPGTGSGGRLNLLALCLDAGDGCPGIPANMSCTPETGVGTWYARMQPADMGNPSPKPVSYFCVTRHDHSGVGRRIPGTARWRWVDEDEKLWIKCAAGCCTVN